MAFLSRKTIQQIISFSAIIVLLIFLIFLVLTAFHLEQLTGIDFQYNSQYLPTNVYIYILFIFLMILTFIFILLEKRWAYSVIYFLLICSVLLLIFQTPIDWINISIITFLTIILEFTKKKRVKSEKKETISASETEVSE